MFKKLERKILIINIITILLVIIITFSAVFAITLTNMKQTIDQRLQDQQTKEIMEELNHKEPKPNQQLPSSASFWIEVDSQGNITNVNTPPNTTISDQTYIDLVNDVDNKSKQSGYITYNESYFAYKTVNENRIVFVDITDTVTVLLNFIYAFIIVILIALIIIFFFSKYAALNAVKPVKLAFNKQRQFISDASHELKTPLTIINANIEQVLSQKESSVASQEQWLGYIKSEGLRMNVLINDLLYLAKVDYSDEKKIYSDVDLSKLLSLTVLSMDAVAFENSASITTYISDNITVQGSIDQLKQVILILIDNAIKYSTDEKEIKVVLEKTHGNIELKIINNTSDIKDGSHNELFDRFYRLDSSRTRDTGGYGLGLSIAKSIIENHSGSMNINSINNQFEVIIKF